jgi:transcription factor E
MKTIMPVFEELAKKICGPNCTKLVKIMEVKDNISEFDLADKMKINVNEMRTMLYKLSEQNLVYSTRKKDKEKGWYIYYWSFNFKHARDLLLQQKNQELEQFQKKLRVGSHEKYICQNSCGSYSLEQAMELNFRCPECNSLLEMKEVKYKPEIINKKIKEIEEQLELLNKAIIIERIPIEKVEEKEKKLTRKKVTKKVIKKKTVKKTVKKKVTKKKIKKKTPSKKPIKKVVKKKTTKKIVKKSVKKIVKKPLPKKAVDKPKKKVTQKKTGIIGKLKRRIKF